MSPAVLPSAAGSDAPPGRAVVMPWVAAWVSFAALATASVVWRAVLAVVDRLLATALAIAALIIAAVEAAVPTVNDGEPVIMLAARAGTCQPTAMNTSAPPITSRYACGWGKKVCCAVV